MKTKLLMMLSLVLVLCASSCAKEENEFPLAKTKWVVALDNEYDASGVLTFTETTFEISYDPGSGEPSDIPTSGSGTYVYEDVIKMSVDGKILTGIVFDGKILIGSAAYTFVGEV